MCGVRGREVERRTRNPEVLSSSPGSGSQLFIGPHIRREYWCSSQKAESGEISIGCKNLFLSRCKINMFKVSTVTYTTFKLTGFSYESLRIAKS